MPAPNPPAVLRHHVLSDPTGRRRHRLVIAGRVVTAILGLWLVVLILGGLGLQPLAGLPLVANPGPRADADTAGTDQDRTGSADYRAGGHARQQRQNAHQRHGDDPVTVAPYTGGGRRQVALLRFRVRNPPAHWWVLGTCLVFL